MLAKGEEKNPWTFEVSKGSQGDMKLINWNQHQKYSLYKGLPKSRITMVNYCQHLLMVYMLVRINILIKNFLKEYIFQNARSMDVKLYLQCLQGIVVCNPNQLSQLAFHGSASIGHKWGDLQLINLDRGTCEPLQHSQIIKCCSAL